MQKLHIKTTFERVSPENYQVEKRTEENLIVCEKCKGLGVTIKELFDYYTWTETIKKQVCSACKGTGKLLETTITFKTTNIQGMPLSPVLKLESLNQERIEILVQEFLVQE